MQQALDECRAQLTSHEKKFQDGERQMRRLHDEVRAQNQQPKPEVPMGLPSEVQAAMETRFSQIEETLQKHQRQYSQWQGDGVKDAQAIETYLTQVHNLVTELHQRQESTSSSSSMRPRKTKLSVAARRGDMKVELQSPEVCRIGEVVLIGGQEAKTVVNKDSLVFRFPLERDCPEGTIVRPLEDSEFLQAEGERLCLYRRGQEDDIHFKGYVDLIERSVPGRADIPDEEQDRAYAEDLDERIQRIIDARGHTCCWIKWWRSHGTPAILSA